MTCNLPGLVIGNLLLGCNFATVDDSKHILVSHLTLVDREQCVVSVPLTIPRQAQDKSVWTNRLHVLFHAILDVWVWRLCRGALS